MSARRFGPELLLLVCSLAVCTAVLELAPYLLWPHVFGGSFSRSKLHGQLTGPTSTAELRAPEDDEKKTARRLVLHPYLGFAPNLDRGKDPEKRRLSFYDPQAPRPAERLVVCLVGGSVAVQVNRSSEVLAAALAEVFAEVPRFAGRPVEVVSLAVPGYKQPQQLIALAYNLYLGARFDVVIHLDGYNEVVLPYTENIRFGVFPHYPRAWRFYAATEGDSFELSQEIVRLRESRHRRRQLVADTPLRSSNFALALWKAADRRDRHRIRALTVEVQERLAQGEKSYRVTGPRFEYRDEAEIFAELVERWRLGALQMDRLCRANGIEYFHFLQPNQYDPGSKPLTEEERKVAIRKRPSKANTAIENAYPLLRQAGAGLASDGVRFKDLTGIFRNETRTLYIDTCCHVNQLGVRLLIDAFVETLRDAEL